MTIVTNAAHLAIAWRRRRERLDAAVTRGIRRAAVAVDRAQVRRLQGSGQDEVGAYPVPVREGHLMQSHFFDILGSRLAVVGNRSIYAHAIHEGRGSSAPYGRRPFLDDAVKDADPTAIMALEVRKAIMAL